jgi:hypothetical protein
MCDRHHQASNSRNVNITTVSDQIIATQAAAAAAAARAAASALASASSSSSTSTTSSSSSGTGARSTASSTPTVSAYVTHALRPCHRTGCPRRTEPGSQHPYCSQHRCSTRGCTHGKSSRDQLCGVCQARREQEKSRTQASQELDQQRARERDDRQREQDRRRQQEATAQRAKQAARSAAASAAAVDAASTVSSTTGSSSASTTAVSGVLPAAPAVEAVTRTSEYQTTNIRIAGADESAQGRDRARSRERGDRRDERRDDRPERSSSQVHADNGSSRHHHHPRSQVDRDATVEVRHTATHQAGRHQHVAGREPESRSQNGSLRRGTRAREPAVHTNYTMLGESCSFSRGRAERAWKRNDPYSALTVNAKCGQCQGRITAHPVHTPVAHEATDDYDDESSRSHPQRSQSRRRPEADDEGDDEDEDSPINAEERRLQKERQRAEMSPYEPSPSTGSSYSSSASTTSLASTSGYRISRDDMEALTDAGWETEQAHKDRLDEQFKRKIAEAENAKLRRQLAQLTAARGTTGPVQLVDAHERRSAGGQTSTTLRASRTVIPRHAVAASRTRVDQASPDHDGMDLDHVPTIASLNQKKSQVHRELVGEHWSDDEEPEENVTDGLTRTETLKTSTTTSKRPAAASAVTASTSGLIVPSPSSSSSSSTNGSNKTLLERGKQFPLFGVEKTANSKTFTDPTEFFIRFDQCRDCESLTDEECVKVAILHCVDPGDGPRFRVGFT